MAEYLSIADAAELTGLTESAIRRRMDRGTLRAVRPQGRRERFVTLAELERAGLVGTREREAFLDLRQRVERLERRLDDAGL